MAKPKKSENEQKLSSEDTRTILKHAFDTVTEAFKERWHSFDGDADADTPWRYSKRERETIRLVISELRHNCSKSPALVTRNGKRLRLAWSSLRKRRSIGRVFGPPAVMPPRVSPRTAALAGTRHARRAPSPARALTGL
jgi:hypothetical protein